MKKTNFERLEDLIKSKLVEVSSSFNNDLKLGDYVFYTIEDDALDLNFEEKSVCFVVKNKSNLKITSKNKEGKIIFVLLDSLNVVFELNGIFELNVVALSNASFNSFVDLTKLDLKLQTFSKPKVELSVNMALISRGFVKVDPLIFVNDNSKTYLNLMAVNLSNFSSQGKAFVNSKDVDVAMNLRCLNLGDEVELTPILEVNDNEVKASHSALIYGFDEDALFYFMAKGLSREDAELLFVREQLGKYLKEKFFDSIIEKVEL
ncbi:MAG: system FeS cluster assembly, SufBD [Candidatus Woesearchaeota archaeon]|nr:system FeS cluster assembly, SufBD [Candidatus Woesearchaeota archaeon]MDN5328066.1 system FeS cluster assembly, SufBD [Candidatus Woesearchaeota archaeon]